MKKVLKGLAAAWVMVGLTLILVLLLEGATQLLFPSQFVDARLNSDVYQGNPEAEGIFSELHESAKGLAWTSYTYWRRKPYQGTYVNVDGARLRRTVNPGAKDGGPMIFFFGGSTMWGTGTKDEETIPSFVAQMLHESGASAQVFNFGESGWVSTQEMIELQKLLQQGARPDIVVFYDGVNDTFSAYQNRAAGLPQNERNREIEFNLTHPYRPLTEVLRVASSAMLSHSRLAQLTGADGAAPVLLPPISYPHRISSTPAEDAVRTYHTNLRIVSALGREFDFAPYFYWQPVVFAKSHQTEYEQLMAGQREALKPFSNDVYSHIVALQTPVANFHNLGELFQDVKEPIFLDYAHIGAEGNRRIAAAMVKDLLPALKAK